MRSLVLAGLSLVAIGDSSGASRPDSVVQIGSKKFTESVILGEIVDHLLRQEGMATVHHRELGGTRILWDALVAGEIDLYPEYTGTIREEIFAGEEPSNVQALSDALARHGVRQSGPLGFNDTYAVGMREDRAEQLGIRRISDLASHAELRFGLSNEFMDRADGWPSLRDRYGLPQTEVRGIDHDLAYRALADGAIDATDLYSTDAEIRYYGLRVLEDDRHHFPEYNAVILYRRDLETRAPEAVAAIARLANTISESTMITMNARAKLDRIPESQVAADFLAKQFGYKVAVEQTGAAGRVMKHGIEHLELVAVSLAGAILISIPLGVLSFHYERTGQLILGIAGVIQTIPSLALLVFMIPLLGIGGPPAVVALFLYSLLPIIRNTHAGLQAIPIPIRESAEALGLPPRARLFRVELPMASGNILAGIKTAAVINVGTATLGALIGAGGYGQPILTGIRLDDIGLILQGAIPAAALALVVQGLFDLIETVAVPRGLRLKRNP